MPSATQKIMESDSQAGPQAEGQPIGQVDAQSGEVTVVRSDGTQGTLSVGAPVYEGDQIQTSDGGRVSMVFQDGSKFSLAEEGSLRIDALIYNPTAGSGTAMFNVSKGVFAFVSGEIAKSADDAMTVETPVATIGIRGTTVVGRAGPEGDDNSITLLPDADGHLGEIAVTNSAGSVIVTDAFQTVSVGGNSSMPSKPQSLGTDAIQRLYGDVYKTYAPKQDDQAAAAEIELPKGEAGDESEVTGVSVGKEALLLEKPVDGQAVEMEIEAGQQINFGFDLEGVEIEQGDASMTLTFADGSTIKLNWSGSDLFAEMPPVFLTMDGTLVQFGNVIQYALELGDPEALNNIETAGGVESEQDGFGGDLGNHAAGLSGDSRHFGDGEASELFTGTPFEVAMAEFAGRGALAPDSEFAGYRDLLDWLFNNNQVDAFQAVLNQIAGTTEEDPEDEVTETASGNEEEPAANENEEPEGETLPVTPATDDGSSGSNEDDDGQIAIVTVAPEDGQESDSEPEPEPEIDFAIGGDGQTIEEPEPEPEVDVTLDTSGPETDDAPTPPTEPEIIVIETTPEVVPDTTEPEVETPTIPPEILDDLPIDHGPEIVEILEDHGVVGDTHSHAGFLDGSITIAVDGGDEGGSHHEHGGHGNHGHGWFNRHHDHDHDHDGGHGHGHWWDMFRPRGHGQDDDGHEHGHEHGHGHHGHGHDHRGNGHQGHEHGHSHHDNDREDHGHNQGHGNEHGHRDHGHGHDQGHGHQDHGHNHHGHGHWGRWLGWRHRHDEDEQSNEQDFIQLTANTEVASLLDVVDMSDGMRGSLEDLLDNLGDGDEESVTLGQFVEAEFAGGQEQAALIHGFVDAVMAHKIEDLPTEI